MRPFLLLFVLACPAVADPGSDEFHDVSPELRKRIDAAIEAGVSFLEKQCRSGEFESLYKKNLSQGGQHMLIVYALIASGSDPDGAIVNKALRTRVAGRLSDKHHMNYARSVAALAYASRVAALEEKYADGKVPGKAKSAIRAARKRVRELAERVAKSQAKEIWRYPGANNATNGDAEDLSATQYVLLALRAGAKNGLKLDRKMLMRTVTYLLREQEADGPRTPLHYRSTGKDEKRYGKLRKLKQANARGWSYKPRTLIESRGKKPKYTGAMSAAGVACLAICKEALLAQGALSKKDAEDAALLRRIDRALEDGWAKLGAHYKPGANPGGGGWEYYYLYGVERVGALLGVPNMGKHWWFKEGAEYLLKEQQEDGSWKEAGGHRTQAIRTSFALLFLNRATKKPAVPVRPPVVSGK